MFKRRLLPILAVAAVVVGGIVTLNAAEVFEDAPCENVVISKALHAGHGEYISRYLVSTASACNLYRCSPVYLLKEPVFSTVHDFPGHPLFCESLSEKLNFNSPEDMQITFTEASIIRNYCKCLSNISRPHQGFPGNPLFNQGPFEDVPITFTEINIILNYCECFANDSY